MSVRLHAPAALTPAKEPQYALDMRLSGHRSGSGRCGKVKILYPTGTQASDPWPVALLTAQTRITYLNEENNVSKCYTAFLISKGPGEASVFLLAQGEV